MKLNKIDRENLKQKYGGRCAYCGAQLGSRWHADHLDPVERSWEYYKKPNGMLGTRTTGMTKPENDRLDNLMPSCVKCNNVDFLPSLKRGDSFCKTVKPHRKP